MDIMFLQKKLYNANFLYLTNMAKKILDSSKLIIRKDALVNRIREILHAFLKNLEDEMNIILKQIDDQEIKIKNLKDKAKNGTAILKSEDVQKKRVSKMRQIEER